MDHFAPHSARRFEGYYSKFDLPSGARLALIITSVPDAQDRPHLVSFSYIPKNSNEYFQREISVESIEMTKSSSDNSFEIHASGIGHMKVASDSITTYSVKHGDFSFTAKTKTHLPWSSTTETPEGPLVHLPLPLHWHVHSLGSECTFELDIPNCSFLSSQDRSGASVVHQEKNWANSFPSAHIWIQARDDQQSPAEVKPSSSSPISPRHNICIAGGQTLGTEAYLLGYRSTTHPSCTAASPVFELDFRPPFAMRLFSTSPTLTAKPDFAARTFTLSACNWRHRIDVHVSAPEQTFFPLSAPFAEGHRDNFLAQSFRARLKARLYIWTWGPRWWDVRGWWVGAGRGDPAVGNWQLAEEVDLHDASLEFGGEYYEFAGSKTRRGR